jgi:hypothetical protein
MHSIVYEPSSHLRDGGGMFSGRLKYIIKKIFLAQEIFMTENYRYFHCHKKESCHIFGNPLTVKHAIKV